MFHKDLVKKLVNVNDNSTLEMILIPKYVHIACGGICLRLSILIYKSPIIRTCPENKRTIA